MKVEFTLQKPDKTGYWMWKIPSYKNYQTFSVSYFDIEKERVYSGNGDVDYYDSWWDENKPLLTYYVGE